MLVYFKKEKDIAHVVKFTLLDTNLIASVFLRGKNRVHLLYHKSPAEWDFHCEVCNQAFAQKSDLKKHRMIHTGK